MYGYGSLGEVKKRTLMKGDSDGINAIYSQVCLNKLSSPGDISFMRHSP